MQSKQMQMLNATGCSSSSEPFEHSTSLRLWNWIKKSTPECEWRRPFKIHKEETKTSCSTLKGFLSSFGRFRCGARDDRLEPYADHWQLCRRERDLLRNRSLCITHFSRTRPLNDSFMLQTRNKSRCRKSSIFVDVIKRKRSEKLLSSWGESGNTLQTFSFLTTKRFRHIMLRHVTAPSYEEQSRSPRKQTIFLKNELPFDKSPLATRAGTRRTVFPLSTSAVMYIKLINNWIKWECANDINGIFKCSLLWIN